MNGISRLLFITFLLATIMLAACGTQAGPAPGAIATVVATPVISPSAAALAEKSDLPPGKAQAEALRAQQMIAARAHAAPKLAHPSPPPPSSPQPREAGIDNMHQGPFPPSDFVVRNVWGGPVGSDWILVYAGAPGTHGLPGPETTGQGALRLYTESLTYALNEIGTFSAPSGYGPLTITAANGDVLQLRTDSGQTLSFNLQTHQYQ